jgi:hypothetical protein
MLPWLWDPGETQAIAWCLTADFYFAILYALKDESTTLFEWFCAPHVVGGVIAWVTMRICSRPAFQVTEAFLERFLVLLLVVSAAGQYRLTISHSPILNYLEFLPDRPSKNISAPNTFY